jgi:hypothetical protein
MADGTSGGVFISYRRGDSGYAAGWLHDRLRERLGSERIFMDVDSLRPGDDYIAKIDEAVGACGVLLAVIGPEWSGTLQHGGQRRIDDADDFVRLEVEAALARDVRVVPVLVGGARMPDAAELPASLAPLARRQAVVLTQESFADDAERLLTSLEQSLAGAAGSRPRLPVAPGARTARRRMRRPVVLGLLGGLAVAAVVVTLLWWAGGRLSGSSSDAFRLVLQPLGPGVACEVTATDRRTGQTVDLAAGDKYQRRSFQMLRRDDWTWQASDERCLVKALAGAGDAALPFTQRAFVGDSDAFSVSGQVTIEVRDLAERPWCDVALHAVADGRLLDGGRLQAKGEKVVLDAGGESPVYIAAVDCEIVVSTS